VVGKESHNLDRIHLEENRIDFCQMPFEIYKAVKPKKA